GLGATGDHVTDALVVNGGQTTLGEHRLADGDEVRRRVEQGAVHVEKYCSNVGMVFQIVDDILDCTSTTGELGKPVGSDAQNDKTTFASLYGVEQSREIADRLTREAVEEIGNIEGNPSFLQALARALLIRLK
ncbi:MAG: polyprenyl synthetase family protein, partial [Oscillospiraceae bacterium]